MTHLTLWRANNNLSHPKGACLFNRHRSTIQIVSSLQVLTCLIWLTSCTESVKISTEQSIDDHYLAAKRLMLAHRYADAESEFKNVLPALERSRDDEFKYMDSMTRLSLACSMQGKLDEACVHVEPVVRYLQRSSVSGDDSELLVVLDELCEQFLSQAKPDSANEETLLRRALKFDQLCHEGNHTRLVEIWSRLAICNIKKADKEEAKQCIDRAINLTFGKDRHSFANNMIAVLQIHVAYNRAGKHREADEFLQSIINQTVPFHRGSSEFIVYDRLGSAYAKFGDIDESIKYYEKSLAIQRKLGHDARTRARTMQKLAVAYEAAGNQTKADSLLRASINILSATEKKNSRFLFDARECYADYLSRQKRFADAKAWKSKAQDGIRELIPE